jgi:hypothetical protein
MRKTMSIEALGRVARAICRAAKEIPTSPQSLAARAQPARSIVAASFDMKSGATEST